MTQLSALIVSDIHAGEEPDTTRVQIEPPISLRNRQPLSDLVYWVEKNDLRVDYVLSPGDIANQADAGGLSYSWRRLNELADLLDARLLATPGNHDIVTHFESKDPTALARLLLPSFPTGDVESDAQFWAQGWVVVENDEHRILILDTTTEFPSFPHGVTAFDGSPEWENYKTCIDRGDFTETVETGINEYLESAPHKLNIALLHHHPQEHQLSEYLQDGYGPMRRGSDLIDCLSKHPRAGRWIVVHGHKHVPQLAHATTATSNGPLVLCAASLGAKLWDPIETVTRNQFHILEATDDPVPGTSSLRGSVRSYTWGYGLGWYESEREGSGLPGVSGFGCGEDFRTLASQIIKVMQEERVRAVPFSVLTARVPQLPYLLPADFRFLEEVLEERGLIFSRDRLGHLLELAKRREA